MSKTITKWGRECKLQMVRRDLLLKDVAEATGYTRTLVIMNPDSMEKSVYNQQKGGTVRKDGFSVFLIEGKGVMNIYPQTMYANIKNRRPTPAVAVRAATFTSETFRKTSPISDSIASESENVNTSCSSIRTSRRRTS
jgi:hypothetical protein